MGVRVSPGAPNLMYRIDVTHVKIRRIRFNDYARTIHTDYRGVKDNKMVGWSEAEKIETEKEYFKRKLIGR